MDKSKAFTALKSLLVSGCAILVWSMAPLLLSSTLTSCEKLGELFGGGDNEEDEGDGNISGNQNGVGTTDGAAPYFQLETTRIELPAVRSEEGIQVRCQTNIMNMHYVLEKFKKCNEGELTSPEDYSFILENPEHSYHSEDFLPYYTNYSSEKQTDNLLIYATDRDSLLATLPIEQATAPHISVAKAEAGVNEITLTLEGKNEACFYSAYISTDSIPLYQVREDLKNGGSGLPFEYTFDLSVQPAYTFSGLAEATKYYIYLQGGTQPGPLYGVSLYTVTTAMRGKEDALILEYALNNLNNRTVYLPFEGRVKGVIDWGDGATESIDKENLSSADLSHTYAQGTESTVEVAFKGTVETLTTSHSTKGEVLKASLTGITQWGTPELKRLSFQDAIALKHLAADTKGALSALTDFTSCFDGCTSLESIPEGLFAMASDARSFDYTFKDCTSLTALPSDLFAHNARAVSFNGTFYCCEGLETLPESLFAGNPSAYSMNEIFYGCTALKELPANLFRGHYNLGYLECAFTGCTSLTTLPKGLFEGCSGVISLGTVYDTRNYALGIFARCTSLKTIPADLFASMTKVTRMPGIFYECKALTNIPEGLFDHNPEVTYIGYSFEGCSNLQSVPASLFNKMRILQSTTRLFYGCQSLTGESPYTLINGEKVHLYERQNYPSEFLEITNHGNTFRNCTNLTDHESMPSDWR